MAGTFVQDLIQRTRKWWPGGIDLWIFIRLVRGDTSSSGHGRDGLNVRFGYAEFHDFLCFSGLLCHSLRRIWISFRYHPYNLLFFLFGEHGSNDPSFRARNMLGRKAIPPRDCDRYALLQARSGAGNSGHNSLTLNVWMVGSG